MRAGGRSLEAVCLNLMSNVLRELWGGSQTSGARGLGMTADRSDVQSPDISG